MKYSFEKVVSMKDLENYVSLAMYNYSDDDSFRLGSYQNEQEDYELHLREEDLLSKVNEAFKIMNARQWIDVQKWLFGAHKKLIEKVNPSYTSYPLARVARCQIRASKKVKSECEDMESVELNYSKEEEIINWWLDLKWQYRSDYSIMDDIHSAIKLIVPTKINYSRKTDLQSEQSEDKKQFLKHSWELILQGMSSKPGAGL